MMNHFSLQLLLLAALITAANLHLISAAETPPPSQLPSRAPPPSPPPPSNPPPPLSPKPSKQRHGQSHRHRKTPPLPPAPSSQTPPPPRPSPPEIQENPLKNIFDFAGWDKVITSADLSSVPLAATFFVPSNNATGGGVDFSPFLILYHIVPQRLTFSDLQKLPPKARLPTLLPNKYIVITNNSPSNFTVDDSRITQPDSFSNAAFVLHGVGKILDYSVYGGTGDGRVLPPPENTTSPSRRPELRKNPDYPREMTSGGQKCYPANGILMVFLTLGYARVPKILFH